MNLNFLDIFSKNTQISNLMKIRLVAAEMFHAYVLTGEVNSRFRNFSNVLKMYNKLT